MNVIINASDVNVFFSCDQYLSLTQFAVGVLLQRLQLLVLLLEALLRALLEALLRTLLEALLRALL